MQKSLLFVLIALWAFTTSAQKQIYDIISYTAPERWKKEERNNLIMYSRIDGSSWAQLCIYKSTASQGSIQADSDAEWQSLVLNQHTITDKEEKGKPQTIGEWTVMSRSGVWQYNGSNVATILTTYSNGHICISTLLNATAQPYMKDYQQLLASLSIHEAALKSANTHTPVNNPAPVPITNAKAVTGNYKFTTTRFDDGWVSTAQENWVEVSKPGIRILIHYPNTQTDEHQFEKLKGDQHAWSLLAAPHYTNIQNLQERGIQDYQSVTFLTADATEKASGKKVYVVLYKKHYDKGNGRYMEVVADSKAAFEKEFGSNYINRSSWDYTAQTKSWDKLAAMQWRNKFQVAATDLTGKWSSSSYASLRYYYVNGGGFAGATATSIADAFTFFSNNTYESDHSGASGTVGNQQFTRQVYKGSVSLTNWRVALSNRFQGATETYDSYFEAVKGGRILQLTDTHNTTLSLVKAQ
ncbi:hypothetical protein HNQ91_001150 [Filimonas zeae]|uniref:Uncharacterized protein n=1 Tax=Filimonas zeae TaxID=1737353 RepID=A0A917IRV7_9BACT|nr:hypothetical protein [Filimonas zeae]MDR6338128.1 hypothetical protein [Filimonas zeae]GGH61856.1 hypothetical protein GCM10011379_11250 [Filimonas zeae]